MKRLTCTLAAFAMLISVLGLAPVSAQTSERRDGMRFLPDVMGQFESLSERPDPLGFHIGGSPNPSTCRHYQGIARVQGADGTPFFLVTRSGNLPDFDFSGVVCDDSPGETEKGNLVVFRMGSREKHGERMRSNRLTGGSNYDDTEPPLEDKASIFFTFQGGGSGALPNYGHPGSMQVVGDVLALPLEHPYASDPPLPKTLIMFFDVSDPESPVARSSFAPVDENGNVLDGAGVLAFTPLADGHYLMMATGGEHNSSLFFYRSTSDDLKSTALSWTFVDKWQADIGPPPGGLTNCFVEGSHLVNGFCRSPDEQYLEQNWPDGKGGFTHQMLTFLREDDINGTLYLAGARGFFTSDTSTIDLYRVDCETPLCGGGQRSEIKLKHISTRDLSPFPNAGGKKLANFAAASTFYVSPSGALLFYSTEHDNDGPGNIVNAGEWRHIFIARDESPTFAPTIVLNEPFEVDEGSSVSLTGSALPPITRPFIQLFDQLHLTGRFGGLYPVVDYPDYNLDDFNNLAAFQVYCNDFHVCSRGFYRKTRSWNWFAPVGCTIRANIEDIDDSSVPPETRTLRGTGLVEHDPDLRAVLNDRGTDNMDQKVSSVTFLGDCDQYYATPISLQWDLDRNGSYETTGSSVTFNAATLDGPSEVAIPVQARHPSGGPTGQTTARVRIRNVAPKLTPLRLTDGAGNEVNVAVPFVLTKLPVTVGARFSDPGVLDHQTATLAWGDGSVDPQTAFTMFDEAFGDGTGAVTHTHRYSLAGSYPIALSVTDDDGGVDTEGTVVRVVTPEQAVVEIIGLLDAAIASTTDNNIRTDLEKARRALAGNPNGNDGALNMIRAGNNHAAIAFLRQAIDWLRRAQAGGADVARQIALLEQVVAALSAA